MLIKALCDYYEYTEGQSEDRLPEYLSEQSVSYEIMLTPDGTISDILDIRNTEKTKNDKVKYSPRTEKLPKRTQMTCIYPNIIEHRPAYIFGLNYEKGVFTAEDKTHKAKKSHDCFIKGNLEFCEDLNSELVRAYVNFINKWKPEEECENPHLLKLGNDYSKGYYCFGLDGSPSTMLHKDPELLKKCASKYESDKNSQAVDESECRQCPIEGKLLPTARIHEKISGIAGGNSVGCTLVCVKESAFESYGKTQSFNSGISTVAMMKYTSMLNKLLADKYHHIVADDMTIVFFALAKNDENECAVFEDAVYDAVDEQNTNLTAIYKEVLKGRTADFSSLNIDENVIFYVAGLTPNSSRISQRFICRDKFGKIMANVIQHQCDMAVKEEVKQVSSKRILEQLISPKTTKTNVPSSLSSALLSSILSGREYPQALLSTVIKRIKTDEDTEDKHFIKMNDTRIGIVKACLNRKARRSGNEEEIKMALDKQNTNPAYLCGRLFALLEYIQQKSSDSKLNRTIKDTFFSTACSTPGNVLPRLVKLSQYYLKKIDNPSFLNVEYTKIMDLFKNGFPSSLTLEEQGKFIMGYYHQNSALYTKKDKSDNTAETTIEQTTLNV